MLSAAVVATGAHSTMATAEGRGGNFPTRFNSLGTQGLPCPGSAFLGQTGNLELCPEPFCERAQPAIWERDITPTYICWLQVTDALELGSSIYLQTTGEQSSNSQPQRLPPAWQPHPNPSCPPPWPRFCSTAGSWGCSCFLMEHF